MLPNVTMEGRAVADPELRFTPSGKAVASMRVAASERRKTDAGGWEDGDRCFLSLSVWDAAAEALVEQVTKGDKVLVVGKLFQREYETRDGEKRQSVELKHATVAKVPTPPRGERDKGNTQGHAGDQWNSGPSSDPWASAGTGGGDPWSSGPVEDPPF